MSSPPRTSVVGSTSPGSLSRAFAPLQYAGLLFRWTGPAERPHLMTPAFTLSAKRGKAIRLKSGKQVKIVNLHGQQVVDTWAFAEGDPGEFMSMEHTRSCLDKLTPGVGDDLFTNRRRPILRLEADTSPGVHDTLLSACDEERYRLLGFKGRHGSCVENFGLALEEFGLNLAHVPSPLNLFENVSIGPG